MQPGPGDENEASWVFVLFTEHANLRGRNFEGGLSFNRSSLSQVKDNNIRTNST